MAPRARLICLMKSVFTQSITNDLNVNLLHCNCQLVASFNSNKDHPLSPQPSRPPENRKNNINFYLTILSLLSLLFLCFFGAVAYNKLKDQTVPPCHCGQMVRKQDRQTRYAELGYYEPSIFGILFIHFLVCGSQFRQYSIPAAVTGSRGVSCE